MLTTSWFIGVALAGLAGAVVGCILGIIAMMLVAYLTEPKAPEVSSEEANSDDVPVSQWHIFSNRG
jgi:hypothetical protein